MEKTKPRVVFTYVEAGMGHITPANAVADEFEKKYGNVCEVIRWYIFRDSKYKTVRKYGKELEGNTKFEHAHPHYAKFQAKMSIRMGSKGSLRFLDFLHWRRIPKIIGEIEEMQPDLLFSTYYSPSHFALKAKKKGKLSDCIVDTYGPDPDIYPAFDRELFEKDKFLVTCDKAYDHALADGFTAENTVKVGFVCRKPLALPDKTQMRAQLGLPQDKFTVLLMDGVYGDGNLPQCTETLVRSGLPLTVVAVCGKNEKLLQKMQALSPVGETDFLPLGFTRNVPDYMTAADLFVGKGSVNGILEAITYRTPVVVSRDCNETERFTSDYFAGKYDYVRKIFAAAELLRYVEYLLRDPSVTEGYQREMALFDENQGAERSAELIFTQLCEKFPELSS